MRLAELWTMKPTKGATKTGHTMIAFDAVRQCMSEDCPLFEDCPYAKRGRCTVELKYLDSIQDSLFSDIGLKMTQSLQNKITLQLMPLYQQLIRLKMEAYTVERACYRSPQGYKVHPVYKEIRAVIAAIQKTMEHLGMRDDYLDAIEASPGDKTIFPGNSEDGMAGYTQAIAKADCESDIFPEGKNKRRRRRMTLEEAQRIDEERKAKASAIDVDFTGAETEEFDDESGDDIGQSA